MTASVVMYELRCPHCSQRNRIKDNVAPVNVICGRCKGSLAEAMVGRELEDVVEQLDKKGFDIKSGIRRALRGDWGAFR